MSVKHHYVDESLFYISKQIKQELESLSCGEIYSFETLNPDVLDSSYDGVGYEINSKKYIYHSYKTWLDLAQTLFCKMLTPILIDEHIVEIRYKKLNLNISFHKDKKSSEKYGVKSNFFNINKNENTSFLTHYIKALESVDISSRTNILNLGINKGDEFAIIKELLDEKGFNKLNFIGIDYSASAVEYSNKRFEKNSNVKCIEYDINKLDELNLEKANLLISIGTLQSTSLEFKPLFTKLMRENLSENSSVILGFPNCRWIDGEMIYGAMVPNYVYSELGVLVKDIHFCKKYLQQHKFRVTITGKDYIFLTATKLR